MPEYLFKQDNNDQCVEYDDGARLNNSEAVALIEIVANASFGVIRDRRTVALSFHIKDRELKVVNHLKVCKGCLVTLSDGTLTNYYSGGPETGQPVVLLHGGGTDHAMLSWRDTLPALINAGYRVYAPDYPGYGNSPPESNKKFTTDNLIYYLEGLIDVLSLKQVILIGISMGGSLALGYTLKNPKQVKHLVLIGSYGLQDKAPSHQLSY